MFKKYWHIYYRCECKINDLERTSFDGNYCFTPANGKSPLDIVEEARDYIQNHAFSKIKEYIKEDLNITDEDLKKENIKVIIKNISKL